MRRALDLPDDLHFVAVVTMGYPAESDEPSKGASVFSKHRKPARRSRALGALE